MIKQNLKTLQLNANGLEDKITELYQYLCDEEIDVACISETHFPPIRHLPTHPDYVMYRLDRELSPNQPRSGGVALIINRSIHHQLLPAPAIKVLEAVGVDLFVNQNTRIRIYSIYLPGGATNQNIQQHLSNDIRILTTFRGSLFIQGDFNAKHRL